jgi:hypothetical protein
VVPHKVNKTHLQDEDISFQMRVTKPIEQPVWVEMHDGESLIARKSERYVRPGEMVTFVLKAKYFDEARKADRLTISITPK